MTTLLLLVPQLFLSLRALALLLQASQYCPAPSLMARRWRTGGADEQDDVVVVVEEQVASLSSSGGGACAVAEEEEHDDLMTSQLVARRRCSKTAGLGSTISGNACNESRKDEERSPSPPASHEES